MGALGVASAQTPTPTTYTALLAPVPLNGATSGAGNVQIVLTGSSAVITESVSGLAAVFNNAAYPHVQHIHGGALGQCPTATADTNGDGVLSTTEGAPAYGGIQTTLSVTGDTSPAAGTNVAIAPSGAGFTYNRTITLDAATITSLTTGKAVIVVHGLNPATAAAAATSSPSELVPSLPLAATSPALCGTLVAQAQVATPTATPAATATVAATPSATAVAPAPPKTGSAGLIGTTAGTASLAITLLVATAAAAAGARTAVRNR